MKEKTHWRKIKTEAGFTLVELIVVIAILGILGAVGGVSYNGYVQKANQAADNVLLDSVNSAFAAACLTDHQDAKDVKEANDIDLSGGKLGSSLTLTGNLVIDEAFDRYAADVSESEWMYYTYLEYMGQGVYEGRPEGTPLTAIQKVSKQLFHSSNFDGKQEELINKIDDLATTVTTDNFLSMFTTYDPGYQAYLTEMGLSDASNTEKANAIVTYIAKNTSELGVDGATELVSKLLTTYTTDYETGETGYSLEGGEFLFGGEGLITNAGLLCSISMGYLDSEYASETAKSNAAATDITSYDTLMTYIGYAMSDVNFSSYIENDENGAQNDVAGYVGALTLLNDFSGQVELSQTGAYTDPEILALVNSILGEGN